MVLVLVLVLIYYSLVFEASWILLYRLTATRALDLGISSRIGANLSL